jgi:hypothetical protein
MQLVQQAIAFNGLPQASWLQFYFMFCFEWSVSQDPIGLIGKWIFTVGNKIHTLYNIYRTELCIVLHSKGKMAQKKQLS